jgi:hypothetical protein
MISYYNINFSIDIANVYYNYYLMLPRLVGWPLWCPPLRPHHAWWQRWRLRQGRCGISKNRLVWVVAGVVRLAAELQARLQAGRWLGSRLGCRVGLGSRLGNTSPSPPSSHHSSMPPGSTTTYSGPDSQEEVRKDEGNSS